MTSDTQHGVARKSKRIRLEEGEKVFVGADVHRKTYAIALWSDRRGLICQPINRPRSRLRTWLRTQILNRRWQLLPTTTEQTATLAENSILDMRWQQLRKLAYPPLTPKRPHSSHQFRPASSAVWGISGRIRQLLSGVLGQPKPARPKRTWVTGKSADTVREKLDRRLRHSRQQRHRTGLEEAALRHSAATPRHRLTDCVTPPERVALFCTTLHRRLLRLTHVTLVT